MKTLKEIFMENAKKLGYDGEQLWETWAIPVGTSSNSNKRKQEEF